MTTGKNQFGSKKKVLRALIATVGCAALAMGGYGCTQAQPDPDEVKVIEIKVSHNQSETHYQTKWLEEVAKRVEEKTNGQVKLTIYSSSQLGTIEDLIDQALAGSDVMTLHNWAQAATLGGVPNIAAISAMYTFTAPEGQSGPGAIYPLIQKLLDSDLFAGWKAELADNGFILVTANWYMGERHIYTDNPNGHPTPEDLKGIALRVPGGVTWQAYFKETPATIVTMDGSEVYTAMQQGTLNGAEGPFAQTLGWSLHELTKSVTLTGHGNDTQGFMLGEKTWNKLSEEQQKILVEAFVWGGDEYTKETIANVEADQKKFEDLGIPIYEADRDAYRALSDLAYTSAAFPEWDPDVRQQIREVTGQS
ncbi:MAG: TRAP transporter substrate-binding protein DctP [Propionibacteriaceae bacterium]|jgi:TRAP-type C4-dicarboxylate transport system substrate-binding protein|nr:TRAP transporter substrate-binding protein DctP [Propionibacteriaceae bacterium]